MDKPKLKLWLNVYPRSWATRGHLLGDDPVVIMQHTSPESARMGHTGPAGTQDPKLLGCVEIEVDMPEDFQDAKA